MLLTQKPQPLTFSRHHHRRHPASLSNIAVVPHPTNTPGLFALSKPPRQPSRHPQRSQSPRFPPRPRLHRPTTTSIADLPSSTIRLPDPTRGRLPPLNRAETEQPRTPSQTPLLTTPTSTAPEPTKPLPFPSEELTSSEFPTLVVQPSGRLARSRRARHKSTPAAAVLKSNSPERSKVTRPPPSTKQPQPSTPIPVPERTRSHSPAHKILSRSDPLSKFTIHTNMSTPLKGRKDKRHRNLVKRTVDGSPLPLAEWDYPAPGSSDDEGDGGEEQPVTPIGQTGNNDRAWFDNGPRTAPLQASTTQGQFPFFTFPPRVGGASAARARTPLPGVLQAPPTPSKPARPAHRRAPSQPASLSRATGVEAMFHFSEDESEGLKAQTDVLEKMTLLFKSSGNRTGPGFPLFSGTGTPSPSPRKHRGSRERESMDGSAKQLFASSSFQIAPEPVELPKPSFLLGMKA